MIIADMHSHTNHSGDCQIPIEEMVSTALSKGLRYYAVTDHHDIDFPPSDISFLLDMPAYMSELNRQAHETPDNFTLLKGIEFGMQPHLASSLATIAKEYPLDFIIGSSHLAKGKDPYQADFYDGLSRDEGYMMYFESIYEWLQCIDTFDTLGHMDYVIRYWRGDDNRKYDNRKFQDIIDAVLLKLIKMDKALEVNASGYLQKLNEPNPSYNVLKRYHELGGELLTIGSDAHLPKNIAHSFDIVESNLKNIGFKSYTIFKKRVPYQIGF